MNHHKPRYKKSPCCSVCGYRRQDAIHLPPAGQPAGSKAWGHEFVPIQVKPTKTDGVAS